MRYSESRRYRRKGGLHSLTIILKNSFILFSLAYCVLRHSILQFCCIIYYSVLSFGLFCHALFCSAGSTPPINPLLQQLLKPNSCNCNLTFMQHHSEIHERSRPKSGATLANKIVNTSLKLNNVQSPSANSAVIRRTHMSSSSTKNAMLAELT